MSTHCCFNGLGMEKDFELLLDIHYKKLLNSLSSGKRKAGKKRLLEKERKQFLSSLSEKAQSGSIKAYQELKAQDFFKYEDSNNNNRKVFNAFKFLFWYRKLLEKINQLTDLQSFSAIELKEVFDEATRDFYLNWKKSVDNHKDYRVFGYIEVFTDELFHCKRSALIENILADKDGKEFLSNALNVIEFKDVMAAKVPEDFTYLIKKSCFYELDFTGKILGQLFLNLNAWVESNKKKIKLLKDADKNVNFDYVFFEKLSLFEGTYEGLSQESKANFSQHFNKEKSAATLVEGAGEREEQLKEQLRQLLLVPVVIFKSCAQQLIQNMNEDKAELIYRVEKSLDMLKGNYELFKILMIGAQKEIEEVFNNKSINNRHLKSGSNGLNVYFRAEKEFLKLNNFERFLLECFDNSTFCEKIEKDEYFIKFYKNIFEKLYAASSSKLFHWCVLKGIPSKLLTNTVGIFDKKGIPYVCYQILPAFDWRTQPSNLRNVTAKEIVKNIKYLDMPLDERFWDYSVFNNYVHCPIPLLKPGSTLKDFFAVYEKQADDRSAVKNGFHFFNKKFFNEVKLQVEVAQLNASIKKGKKTKPSIRL